MRRPTTVTVPPDDARIIAPCGLNCSLCRAYSRAQHPCPGCRGGEHNKSNACLTCPIKNCELLATNEHHSCASCSLFPCAELRQLDTRYATRYGVSPIANIERIREIGVRRFLEEESERWACTSCGERLCMHHATCANCGYTRDIEPVLP